MRSEQIVYSHKHAANVETYRLGFHGREQVLPAIKPKEPSTQSHQWLHVSAAS